MLSGGPCESPAGLCSGDPELHLFPGPEDALRGCCSRALGLQGQQTRGGGGWLLPCYYPGNSSGIHGPAEASLCRIKWTLFVLNETIGVSLPITFLGEKNRTHQRDGEAAECPLRRSSASGLTALPAGALIRHLFQSPVCAPSIGRASPRHSFGLPCLLLSFLFKEVYADQQRTQLLLEGRWGTRGRALAG